MSLTSLIQFAAPLAGPTIIRAGASIVETIGQAESAFRDIFHAENTPQAESADQPSLNTAAEAFKTKLQERLKALGIDASQPIELRLDFFDDLKARAHPDHVLVEQLVRSDDQLLNQLRELVSRFQDESPEAGGDVDKITVRIQGESITFATTS